jgi:hypothetical protein
MYAHFFSLLIPQSSATTLNSVGPELRVILVSCPSGFFSLSPLLYFCPTKFFFHFGSSFLSKFKLLLSPCLYAFSSLNSYFLLFAFLLSLITLIFLFTKHFITLINQFLFSFIAHRGLWLFSVCSHYVFNDSLHSAARWGVSSVIYYRNHTLSIISYPSTNLTPLH